MLETFDWSLLIKSDPYIIDSYIDLGKFNLFLYKEENCASHKNVRSIGAH